MKINFKSFSNKKLYQTLSVSVFNTFIEIPFIHPIVSWNKNKYTWEYLRIKKNGLLKNVKMIIVDT